jgi:catalase
MIPYIEPSPDPLFQARLFIYPDTQRYRLGVNNQQLPCNAPIPKVANFQRAGTASFISQGRRPNYLSSISSDLNFVGPKNAIDSQINGNDRHERFSGTVYRELSMVSPGEIIVQLRFDWKIC